nr:sigma-70 family RNA polymerase sigma factor [Bacteroidota bacterium]
MTRANFKEIFENHFDAVRNYIYYRSGDTEMATDIAQETFMRLWEKQLMPLPDKTKGLLFKMAGDLFVSTYRRQKTELNIKLNIKPETTDESPEDQMEFEELKNNYELALKNLPEKQRIVFLMSRMDGLKYQEIADALDLSIKAVEKRMSLALAYLKDVLKR